MWNRLLGHDDADRPADHGSQGRVDHAGPRNNRRGRNILFRTTDGARPLILIG